MTKPTNNGFYWCNHCKRWRFRAEFGSKPSVPCGLRTHCRRCESKKRALRRWRARTAVEEPIQWTILEDALTGKRL